MAKIYITRRIPEAGPEKLRAAGHEVIVSEKDGVLTRDELLGALKEHDPDAVVSLLTDTVDEEVFAAAPNAKIFANYAVGFNNIDLAAAGTRGVVVTNTPDVLTDTVAEHTIALMLTATSRTAEGDRFVRAGRYDGWAPMLLLGSDMRGKTLGIIGCGRIGARVAEIAHKGLGMRIAYTDLAQNPDLEAQVSATYFDSPDALLPEVDVVSIHVPLLEATRHLINAERIARMKPGAYIVNTSRGPVIDEHALTAALKERRIKGAALDVFENEPDLAPGLCELDNVVLTPHIASATEETRGKMSEMVADNILAVLAGQEPPNAVRPR